MTALPTALYDDPALILERAEQGDVMPQTKHTRTCLQCRYCQSSLRGWPCRRNNMPAMTGRCRKFQQE